MYLRVRNVRILPPQYVLALHDRGWILGNEIDGTQAEYVRTAARKHQPLQDSTGVDEEALVMLSDILPTAFECGVLNGRVQPGSTVAIVGAGPIGLAALLDGAVLLARTRSS